ncbi:hypothetical protein, partial [Actinomyces ruminis]|uniref:hypothetical protein n=1 Tax=Actinomyces ruminis TaxID=1937003 RepID=UPI001C558043
MSISDLGGAAGRNNDVEGALVATVVEGVGIGVRVLGAHVTQAMRVVGKGCRARPEGFALSQMVTNAPATPKGDSVIVGIMRLRKRDQLLCPAFVTISDVENVSVCSVLGVCDPISDWRPGWVCPGIDLSA